MRDRTERHVVSLLENDSSPPHASLALEGSFSNLLDPFGERKRARESEEADESEDSSSDASETEEERSAKRHVVQDDEVYHGLLRWRGLRML